MHRFTSTPGTRRALLGVLAIVLTAAMIAIFGLCIYRMFLAWPPPQGSSSKALAPSPSASTQRR